MAVLFLGAACGGAWAYGMHQWRAAQAAVADERLDEARSRLGFCLRLWPRNPAVHLLAARVDRLAGNFTSAEAHLNRCLQLEGGATEAVQLEFLLIRVQAGEVDQLAPTLFLLIEDGHPESAVIFETIARAFMHRLRFKPAYACLSRWIELQPQNAKARYWRGWVLERLNHPKAAKDDYERALEIDPGLVAARLRLAEMLLEDKQAPEAAPHLNALAQLAPGDPRVRARLGMCRFLQGESVEARQLMEAALVELPDDAALLVYLATLDNQEGRPVEAERLLRRVLATDPGDTEALFVLASSLRLQNRQVEAEATLAEHGRQQARVTRINALLKDVADTPSAKADDYAELGSELLQAGRDKQALHWLDRALESDPNNRRAHKALADFYTARGESEKAEMHRKYLTGPSAP